MIFMSRANEYRRRRRARLNDFLEEDTGSGDITSNALLTDEKAHGIITANENCVLAGLKEAKEIFALLKLNTKSQFKDGAKIKKGTAVLEVEGHAKSILLGERTALNFLMRMSGIATLTCRLIEKCSTINPRLKIAATRKTTPGFRIYEKKAVIIGGGIPHRYGLYDGILIKDGHIKIVGSVEECIKRAKKTGKKIEIEVENVGDAVKAANAGADIVMLDNFSVRNARTVYEKIRKINKNIKIEISGGITEKNIQGYAKYADIISLGRLTYSVKAIDFSLDIVN